jgi:putative transposase
MLARGVVVAYETVRSWCARFGPEYANGAASAPTPPPATSGTSMRFSARSTAPLSTCGAVDQHGDLLDILLQSRRNAVAAKRFSVSCSRACGMCRG